MQETELILQSKAGNKSAMNTLLKNNYKILFGYVLKMTGNVQQTEDIVQETMLKAILNLPKFKPEAKFSTWLVTIATNVFRDSIRKNKRLVDVENFDTDVATSTSTSTSTSRNFTQMQVAVNSSMCVDGIEEQVISKLEVSRVIEILMKLSYEKRAAFVLKNYYGYKYEEIAQILNCPVGTVRSRIHNCIECILNVMEGSEW